MALIFYLRDQSPAGSAHGSLENKSAGPTTATITTGWTVGLTAVGGGEYSALKYGTDRLASTFGATVLPAANSLGSDDAFVSEIAYDGAFAAANWTLSAAFIARGFAVVGGNLSIRLYASEHIDGTNAREITTAAQSFSSVSALTTATAQTTTLTFNPGAFSLNNEYLFLQCAWSVTGVSLSALSDVAFQVGANSSVTTAAFTPAAAQFTGILGDVDAQLGNFEIGSDASDVQDAEGTGGADLATVSGAGSATGTALTSNTASLDAIATAVGSATGAATVSGAATADAVVSAVGSAIGTALASGSASLDVVSGAGAATGDAVTSGAATAGSALSATASASGGAIAAGAATAATATSAIGSATGTALSTSTAAASSATTGTGTASGTALATGNAASVSALSPTAAASGAALATGAGVTVTAVSAIGAGFGDAHTLNTGAILSALTASGSGAASSNASGSAVLASALAALSIAAGSAYVAGSAVISAATLGDGTADGSTVVGAQGTGDATPAMALPATGDAHSGVVISYTKRKRKLATQQELSDFSATIPRAPSSPPRRIREK